MLCRTLNKSYSAYIIILLIISLYVREVAKQGVNATCQADGNYISDGICSREMRQEQKQETENARCDGELCLRQEYASIRYAESKYPRAMVKLPRSFVLLPSVSVSTLG